MSESTMDDMIPPAPPRDRWLRVALKFASVIRCGRLTVVLPDGSRHLVAGAHDGPEATVVLRDRAAIRRLVVGGNVGLAEAYIEGLWDSPDLRAVMALAAANEAEWLKMLSGSRWMQLVNKVLHRLRPNSRRGARRNIVDHYDLGNEFYARWLDPTMTYSSALFESREQSLEDAQRAKVHRLCQALDLKPGMTLLEIGCGWGAFAEIAARDYGAIVTGITLSPSQLDYARAGLAWKAEHWFGRDYAETLSRWNESFQAVWPRIAGATRLSRMPCDARFKRLWEYYLLYCETGFRAGWTDVGQILLAKPA